MNTYHLTDNATLSQQLAELPESDSTMAQCSHLPDSTRVCYMRAPLGWQLFPGGSQPYATPLLPRMREAGIMRPDDVVVVGHGLWCVSGFAGAHALRLSCTPAVMSRRNMPARPPAAMHLRLCWPISLAHQTGKT